MCLSAVSTTNWQYLQSLVERIPVSNPSKKAYSVVENAKQKMGNRMPFLYTGAQFPYFRRRIKPGLMIPSTSITVSGFGQLKMYILHFNVIQLKAVCSALKRLPRQIPHKRILIASDNTTVFGYLNKQGGGSVYLLVWHSLAYCNP